MRFLFSIALLLLLSPGLSFGQKNFDDTVYYMKTMEKVSAKHAHFFRPPVEKVDATHYKVAYCTMDGKARTEYVLIPQLIGYNYSLELNVATKDGPCRIYKNGILTSEYNYAMNKYHGYCRYMEDDGSVFAEGNYKNGYQIGEWKYYDQKKLTKIINYEDSTGKFYYCTEYRPSGVKRQEGYLFENVVNGKRERIKHSTWLTYFENGKLKIAFDYKYGVNDGMFAFYDSAYGGKISQGWMKDNMRDSLFIRYYPSGKIKLQVGYKNDKQHGKFIKYDDSTEKVVEIGNYYEGKLVGTWYEYYPGTDIVKEQSDYMNDIGNAVRFDKETHKKIAEGPYTGSSKNGLWKYYDVVTGAMWKTQNFKNDQLSGEVTLFDKKGTKRSVVNYVSGELNGTWQEYYEDGKSLWFSADYQNDTLHGLLETFYENGKAKRKQSYENGKLISGTCYDVTGGETECKPFLQKAEFKEDIMTYIGKNLKYPASARSSGIEGKVLVGFYVSESGLVVEPTIVKGFDEECNKEALRLVSQMPPWKPAKADDRPVSSYQTLPVVFWIH